MANCLYCQSIGCVHCTPSLRTPMNWPYLGTFTSGNAATVTPENKQAEPRYADPARYKVGDIVLLHDRTNDAVGVVQITGIPPEPRDWTEKYYGVMALSPIVDASGSDGRVFVARSFGAQFNVHYSEMGKVLGRIGSCL